MQTLPIVVSKYACPHIPFLKGCVNDSKEVRGFLTERLHVPDSHIMFLTNKDASRDATLPNGKRWDR